MKNQQFNHPLKGAQGENGPVLIVGARSAPWITAGRFEEETTMTILPIDTNGSMRGVFDEIVRERMAQDKKWGGSDHDIEHSEWDWRHFVTTHTERAIDLNFRKQMIRVAALAIAAIQAYDIKQAKQKEIVDLGTTIEER